MVRCIEQEKSLHQLSSRELEDAWMKIVGQPPPVIAPKRMMFEALKDCSKIERSHSVDGDHVQQRGTK